MILGYVLDFPWFSIFSRWWDRFQMMPRENVSSSDTFQNMFKFFKIVCYILLFILVLGSAVVNKLCILLMTSSITNVRGHSSLRCLFMFFFFLFVIYQTVITLGVFYHFKTYKTTKFYYSKFKIFVDDKITCRSYDRICLYKDVKHFWVKEKMQRISISVSFFQLCFRFFPQDQENSEFYWKRVNSTVCFVNSLQLDKILLTKPVLNGRY